MFRNALKDVSTFLSPPVQYLLVDCRKEHVTSSCDGSLLTSHLTFNWDCISTRLKTLADNPDCHSDQEINRLGSDQLWLIIMQCGRKVQECEDIPVHLLEWTMCAGDIQLCFNQMKKSENSIMPLKISLHLSSIFEHAVGNVYKLREKNVPFLLRDLLSSTQLLGIFGNLPMLVAKCLLGTPLSLNIRNICWHGFPAPKEICMDLAAALLVLISSFGELLNIADISSVPCRPKMGKSTWARYLPAFESLDFPQLKCHRCEVAEMLKNFDCIPETHYSYWTSSLDFLCSESYGECLLILLPALEHTLRCAYCLVNECPNQMLVAEQRTLYTTMDEILDQYLIKSESVKVKNRLPSLLGNKLMDLLLDIFSSLEGPRIRDKLSHGECNLEDIPPVVANNLLCISLLVLQKLGSRRNIDFGSCLMKVEENFTAKFHSISFLKYEASTVLEKLKELQVFFKPTLIIPEILDLQASLSAQLPKFKTFSKYSDRNSLIEFCLKEPVVTLYRNKSDLAHISKLRKIIAALHQASNNCLVALQNRQNCLTQFALRSRQRESYSRMLEFIPSFQAIVEFLILIILAQLLTLPQMIVNLKFIKNTLHYADNLSSLSCLKKNRWTEIRDKTTCFCQQSISLINKKPETSLLNVETNVSKN